MKNEKSLDDAKVSLKVLFGLSDGLSPYVNQEDMIGALYVVLYWAAGQGVFDQGAPSPTAQNAGLLQPQDQSEIPAGPQVAPEVAAGGLNDKADTSVAGGQGPEGGEAFPCDAVDPPATPVAGGVASDPPGKVKPARWSEAEDQTVVDMRVKGHPIGEIADAVGRPHPATAFRITHGLKDRIAAAREGRARDVIASSTAILRQTGRPGSVQAPAVPAAPATSAPPIDPGRPAWWKQAQVSLNVLGYSKPFDASLDLQLVEDLLRGMKLDVLAADMRIGPQSLNVRWRALLTAIGVPAGARPAIDEQKQLLEILRYRAGKSAAQAAAE